LALFVGGSALCGMAQSIVQLIAFRAVQGLGGGMLTPIGMALMFRAFPPNERARTAGIIMVPTLLAPALGPIIGGFLATNVGWRWIFWVNLPIGIVAFLFGLRVLREHREPSAGSFDAAGFVLGGAGLALTLFAISEGPRSGWTSSTVLTCGSIGLAILAVFVVVELRKEKPMLDLRLLGNRIFRTVNLVLGLAMASFLGMLFALPLYLQNYRGITPLGSGLTTFAQAFGVMASTVVASRLYNRIGPRRMMTAGMGAAGVVMMGFLLVGEDTSLWYIRGLLLLRGVCSGFGFMPMQAAAYSSIQQSDLGRASSIFSTMRQIFISIGVAITATILSAYMPLSGPPTDRDQALTGYHVTFAVNVLLALVAALVAWLFVKDEDAAASRTLH
jgi:EmrB/QacA subfamily drug resistance transporter